MLKVLPLRHVSCVSCVSDSVTSRVLIVHVQVPTMTQYDRPEIFTSKEFLKPSTLQNDSFNNSISTIRPICTSNCMTNCINYTSKGYCTWISVMWKVVFENKMSYLVHIWHTSFLNLTTILYKSGKTLVIENSNFKGNTSTDHSFLWKGRLSYINCVLFWTYFIDCLKKLPVCL